jgi:hypothetical protein
MENSKKFNGIPWKISWKNASKCVKYFLWDSMEFHGKFHGIQWNSMKFSGISWFFMEFHGIFHGKFHGIP